MRTTEPAKVFIPLSEQMIANKQEISKTAGVIIISNGNPSIEDVIEGIKATSDRLARASWRPFRCGKDIVLGFPDERTLNFFTARVTPMPCPNGTFRINKWKIGEDRRNHFRFPHCRWLAIRGLPPYAWTRNAMAKIVSNFGHLIDMDPDTEKMNRLDRARVLIGCNHPERISSEMMVIVGGDQWKISIEIENPVKKRISFDPPPANAQPEKKNLAIFQWAKSTSDNRTGKHVTAANWADHHHAHGHSDVITAEPHTRGGPSSVQAHSSYRNQGGTDTNRPALTIPRGNSRYSPINPI